MDHPKFLHQKGTEFFYPWSEAKASAPGLVGVDEIPSSLERKRMKVARLRREGAPFLRRLELELAEEEAAAKAADNQPPEGGGPAEPADPDAEAKKAAAIEKRRKTIARKKAEKAAKEAAAAAAAGGE